MRSLVAHYKNKYPRGQVQCSDSSLDVFVDGEHRVALRKNGAMQWVDQSKELGCVDEHDLAPIPQNARAWKCYVDGIRESEEFAERRPISLALADMEIGGKGKVPNYTELKAAGAQLVDGEPGELSVDPAWLASQVGSKKAKA